MVNYFSNNPQGPNPLLHGGIFILRAGLAAIMFFMHGLPHAIAAWSYIWKKQPWELVETLTELQYPFPAILSSSTAIILTIFPLSIFLGFLSRISAAILVVFLVTILVAAGSLEGFITQESIFLYLIGYSTLIVTGSGQISLDTAFRRSAP
jgi:uncharacterized membrane protein YphA (DoxX/SURF4 family)